MAAYKETPRQKMIAMMYLVLTALLALNVSKEILDAFLVVNESMVATNEKFKDKIDDTYSEFEKQYNLNQAKVGEFWEKAQKAKHYTDSFVSYLDSIKYVVIALSDDITIAEAKKTPLGQIKKKDNFDKPTHFFIGSELKKGEAFQINKKLNEYRENMLSLVNERVRKDFNLGLKTDGDYRNANGEKESWENHHFYHTILAADVTIMNKIIAEVQNAESDVLTHLMASISAEDFKFDKIGAKVVPNTNYVFVGDQYKAEIFVAAYDTKQNPEVYILDGADSLPSRLIGSAKKIEGKEGMVKLELPATTEGTKKYAGIIRMAAPTGEINDYYFSHSFTVAKPSATVSATKMNVFYRGVDNPIAISASGKADNQLSVDITAGSIVKGDKGWIVKNLPTDALETTIKIYADEKGGKRFMGQQLFRVKRLPDPLARIMGVQDGKISTSKLVANPFVVCALPDYVDFEYDFKVTSFTMIIPLGGGYVNQEKSDNQMFSQKMLDQIKNLKRNDVIIFQDIKVRGPEGTRKIEDINVTIN